MAPPDPEEIAPDAAAEEADAAVRRHRAWLERLGEVGMEMVEAVRAEMIAARGDATAVAEAARTFAHLARAVRHTIALDARLLRDARLGRAEAERDRWREEAWLGRRARKEQVRARVQDLIAHDGQSRSQHGLERRLHQRLDREDDRDAALFAAGAPLGLAIGRLCYELGVRPDWQAFDGQPWAPEAFDAYQALSRERPLEVELAGLDTDANGDPLPPTIITIGPRRPSG